MWSRVLLVVLAGWVLSSGYAWPHTTASLVNNWLVGIGLVAFGLLSMFYPRARYIVLELGVWLFIFTLFTPPPNTTASWNDAMVAVAIFMLSLAGGQIGGCLDRRLGRPSHP